MLIGTVSVENSLHVRYKLNGIGVSEEPKGLFHINEDDGSIYVHQKIDHEKHSLFRWEFNAINTTSLEVDTKLGIQLKILDINDNAPEFSTKSYKISINESSVQGVSFFSLLARDIDEPSTPNSDVWYSILSQTPVDTNVEFTIDHDKGFLSFKGCLDYKTSKSYKLIVQAKDNGTPTQKSSTCEILVSITDRNNHLPVWKGNNYGGIIPERESNVTILRFSVTDQDTPHTSAWRAVYTITAGNEHSNYRIETDPETNDGVLTVVKALDFETGPTCKLSISVTNEEPLFMCKVVKKSQSGLWIVDTGKTLGKKMQQTEGRLAIVKVLDVNDPPELHPPQIIIYLEETAVPGLNLGIVNATDSDIAFPNVIKYHILTDPADWISVDENTGIITSKASLDRESQYVVNSSYMATLLAVDDGVPAMTSTATLVINLKDINDNTPELSMPYVIACASPEESVITVPVADKDIDPYSGPFHFELLGENNLNEQLILKDSHGYNLEVIKLKNASKGNHTLHFQIADRQGMTSHQNLTVYVCECLNGGACLMKMTGPPSLGGGAIAFLLLALLLFGVICFLLCKIETGKVRVPFDQEPLNTMVVYNGDAGNKDCEASTLVLPNQNLDGQSSGSQGYGVKEELDGQFHRASTRRYSTQAVVGQNVVKISRSINVQGQSTSERAAVSSFDRANKRRHSSFHIKEQQRPRTLARSHSIAAGSQRATLVPHISVNGYHAHTVAGSGARRTSHTTNVSMSDYKFKTLETFLMQALQNSQPEEDNQDNCRPHVFAEEGELSKASSLETISIEGSNFSLDRLHHLGSRFNILETICAEQMELKSQPNGEEAHSPST